MCQQKTVLYLDTFLNFQQLRLITYLIINSIYHTFCVATNLASINENTIPQQNDALKTAWMSMLTY